MAAPSEPTKPLSSHIQATLTHHPRPHRRDKPHQYPLCPSHDQHHPKPLLPPRYRLPLHSTPQPLEDHHLPRRPIPRRLVEYKPYAGYCETRDGGYTACAEVDGEFDEDALFANTEEGRCYMVVVKGCWVEFYVYYQTTDSVGVNGGNASYPWGAMGIVDEELQRGRRSRYPLHVHRKGEIIHAILKHMAQGRALRV